jgi:hypothetical protein
VCACNYQLFYFGSGGTLTLLQASTRLASPESSPKIPIFCFLWLLDIYINDQHDNSGLNLPNNDDEWSGYKIVDEKISLGKTIAASLVWSRRMEE